jgi:hypothetical protein
MSKRQVALLAFVLAGIFGLGIVLGFLIPRLAGSSSAPRVYNTATMLQEVQTLSHLVTVKYVMEKIVILEDPPQNTIRRFLPDATHVILLAHGIVNAGLDLGKLKPGDLEVSGKNITIRLPPAQIMDAYLDDKQTQIVERNTGFMRSFNKDLEQSARQNAVEDIRRAARSGGILKDADERARAQLTSFFRQMGFEKVEFRPR